MNFSEQSQAAGPGLGAVGGIGQPTQMKVPHKSIE